MSERNNGETILVFLLGGAIGACLGLLFAPQSGEATRKKGKDFFDSISERTGELIEEGKEKYEEIKAAVKK
ncbi:MAG: YtxH domain-containing protein [Elusimicrobiota bacterium]